MHSREYFRVHFSANIRNSKENNLLYGYLYGVQQGIPFITKLKREIIERKKNVCSLSYLGVLLEPVFSASHKSLIFLFFFFISSQKRKVFYVLFQGCSWHIKVGWMETYPLMLRHGKTLFLKLTRGIWAPNTDWPVLLFFKKEIEKRKMVKKSYYELLSLVD